MSFFRKKSLGRGFFPLMGTDSIRRIAGAWVQPVLVSFPLIALVTILDVEVYRHADENAGIYRGIAALLSAGILAATGVGAWRERKLAETTSQMLQAQKILLRSQEQYRQVEHKQVEEALARANQELIEKQYAVDQAAIVAITDTKGRITYANDNFCRISGYTREELLGANHRIVKSGAHSKKFFRDMYRRIATGQVWRGELCNKAKDGSLYWVDTTIVPQFGPAGKPIAYMAIRIDITERRLAEEERDRSQKFLNTILEHVPVPIYVKDAKDLRYILINRAGEKHWGSGRGEMIGKTAQEIYPKKEGDLIAARDELVAAFSAYAGR